MVTFTVEGITYNVTDHSAGAGLSEADVERMIRNLHTNAASSINIAA